MRRIAFIATVAIVASCALTEPTYVDVEPVTAAAVAERLGIDLTGEISAADKARLRDALAEELGYPIDDLYVVEDVGDPDDPTDDAVVVTAERPPALEEAGKAVVDNAPPNPTSWGGWLLAALCGAPVIVAGVAGWRGRKKR